MLHKWPMHLNLTNKEKNKIIYIMTLTLILIFLMMYLIIQHFISLDLNYKFWFNYAYISFVAMTIISRVHG